VRMLSSFSSWVRYGASESKTEISCRVVVIGDHYPATNERIRKRHWRSISKALEGWCTTETKTLVISENSTSGAQVRLPLTGQKPPGTKTKLEQQIDKDQKAQLAVFSQHLSSKLTLHAQRVQKGTLQDEISSGNAVIIQGLQSASAAKFNGAAATVIEGRNEAGRFKVKIKGHEKPFLLKEANIKRKKPASEANSTKPANCQVSLAETFDLMYLGSFVMMAIKFWKPVGINASEQDDNERMLRFIERSHDITWKKLFQQINGVLEASKKNVAVLKEEKLKGIFKAKISDVESCLSMSKKFSAQHAEDEDERYCLTFFMATKNVGDSALQNWCSWADKLSYMSRELALFNHLLEAMKTQSRIILMVENNIALAVLDLLANNEFKCAHFAGNMARSMPNNPVPVTTKFGDEYLQKTIPGAFELTDDGSLDTDDLISKLGESKTKKELKKRRKGKNRGKKKGRR